ncbi:hypothetical protein EVAR_26970_1 [Eumeta japonica]|uniref:Uncharacterized protein n=1 Tax=Eumeta variegata TaxID=151549 RepID=A0A4C1VMR1_EUMVA|nr:hypothetical protein EVAR_26970_1 [Eumeta japonica]
MVPPNDLYHTSWAVGKDGVGGEAAAVAAAAESATCRSEDGTSPSTGESEKSSSAPGRAALPNHTTATTITARRLAQEVASLKAAMTDMTKILISILGSIKEGQDPTQNILEGLTLAGGRFEPQNPVLEPRRHHWEDL